MVALGRPRHGDSALRALTHGVIEAGAAKKGGDIIARAPGIGTSGAITCEGGVYQGGIDCQQGLRIKAELFLAGAQQVADKHLGLGT